MDRINDGAPGRLLRAAFLLSWLLTTVRADVRLDPAFDSGPGTEVFIEHAIPLPDGRILACGAFTTYNLEPVRYIMRLNENGTRDPSFHANVNGWIRHMAVQPDGKIIIGGAFSAVDGVARNLIARLNPDGSLDPSFDPGSGFEEKIVPPDPNPPYVFWLALQPDGKVLAVGSFAKFNGESARGIARLNADGSRDKEFAMGSGLDSWGRFVMVQPDSRILVTGWFTDYNGFSCNRMVRLHADGTPDGSFRPYFGDKTAIYSAALLADGKMIVSGHSKSDFGLFMRGVTRLNPDGSEDSSFLAHTDDRTESILVQPDGKFLVCGWFSKANDQPHWRLARFNADGSVDDSFSPYAEFFIWNMALDRKGRLLVVGGFPRIMGVERCGIARLIEGEAGTEPDSNPEPEPEPEPLPVVKIGSARLLGNGTFQLSVPTVSKRKYFLECRDSFTDGDWITIDEVVGNDALCTLGGPIGIRRYGCYRVRIE